MAKKHLIVGCGAAGLAALERIRQLNAEDEVKLVTAENYPPYSPTSLPYLLAGRISEDALWSREGGYFSQMRSTLARGKELVRVLLERKHVLYGDGTGEHYDDLLIATGAEPSVPPIPRIKETGFLTLRTLADCRRLSQELKGKKDIIILGAGLVGMELAACLLERGHRVKVVEKETRVLPRYFDAEAASLIEAIFRAQGADIYLGRNVEGVRREERKVRLAFSSDGLLEADLLVVAVGMKARTSFLEGTGVVVNDGVVVNRRMRTSVPGIYAAGDVAEAPDFFFGRLGVNPILPSAISQGKIAGANMAGEEQDYPGWISRIIFNFLGHTAFSAGLASPLEGDYQVLAANSGGGLSKIVFKDNKLVGVMFIDREVDPGVILYLIRNRIDVAAHREALVEKPRETSRWLMLRAEKESFVGG